ncbi:HEAT repeat domain-containing protein [Methanoregula sp.]|uniref:HEAT repeat domain-containing protein n=1 Tax=Methanoregula sp. TaxID=2052170 RepID=UPI003561DEF3
MEEPALNSSAGGLNDPEPPSGDERLRHFIGMLSDDDEMNRWKAAEVLGRIGDTAAVAPLIDTLWDEDARVRLKAAWALGMIGDPEALRPLQRLYRMEREDAQEIIEEAIALIKRIMAEPRG